MVQKIKIKKGLDIPLEGKAEGKPIADTDTTLYGIVPDDFPGIAWKARVAPGDSVAAGDTLLSDKASDRISLSSPVAGTVKEIIRGERRHILAVTVCEDKESKEEKEFDRTLNADNIRATLHRSGLWAMMRQRPFDVVPDADSEPRDIFITAFDSAPLAPDIVADGNSAYLEIGIEVLSFLTKGKIYLATRPDSAISSLSSQKGEVIRVEGPHPAGNVGVQIAAIKSINKGDIVWTLDARTAERIGYLFSTGHCDFSTTVALTGPEVKNPHLTATKIGASVASLLKDELKKPADEERVISGNVLTGVRVNPEDGFLRFPYRQITVIEEGNHRDEFMGWASLSPKKYSVKRSFPAFLRGLAKPFPFDARIKGGHRGMILSEEYDKVFPFDIYPEYLIKAVMAGDIDRMEQLGIYEVAPEDFALPEFVDTSKLELQKIIREGLDRLRKEL